MVIGAFPAAKLGALLIKQVSKPIANVVKTQAKQHPFFRKYICMPPAQLYNWVEVRSKMWMLNLGKPVNIPVLNEAMAIELGANLLGEGIIFIIAAGILISEYNRSSRKEDAKEKARIKEMSDLQNSIHELFIQSEEQAAHIRELTRKLGDLDTTIKTPSLFKSAKSKPPPSEHKHMPVTEYPGYSEETIITIPSTLFYEKQELPSNAGLILKVVHDVEHELWTDECQKWEPSLLTQGLTYLYDNIFKVPIN